MQQDPAQAVPILQKILAGNQPEELKSRALFVLAQSGSPQAAALLGEIAHGQSGEALQIKAIQMIAAALAGDANATLTDVYQHSSSLEVKRAVLQSYLVTGDSRTLLEVARKEADAKLVKTAVRTLGAMGKGEDLLALYRSTSQAETKADIIEALLASGHSGVAALTGIVDSEQDTRLHRAAIRNLGIAGGRAVAPTLVATYQKSADEQTRRAIAEALFLADDAHDLVTLARAEKDSALRQHLVKQLSLMQDKEATGYILEILSK
jgi:HEAT repeat protein